jgi:hypothetical protein
MKSRVFRALVVCAALFSLVIHRADTVRATSTTVVISEFRTRGVNGAADEFVELYNVSSAPVNIGGWKINGSNNAAGTSTRATITANTTIGAGCYYLVTNSSASGGPYSGTVAGNQTFSVGITDDGGIALLTVANAIVDQVGMSAGSAYKEGTVLAPLTTTGTNRSYERKPGGSAGSSTDTDNNSADFQINSTSNPQNLSSPCITGQQSTNPSGTMSANPSSLNIGDSLTLTVNVTPGTNPTSTGISVTGNLTAINLGTPAFTDGGNNTFTFTGTIPSGVTGGSKNLSATIADSNTTRTGTASTNVTIQTPTPPSGTGSANPGSVGPGGTTTLTVNVTPGTNPASTGLSVSGDLSAIGGSVSQAFQGNGNTFTYDATVAANTTDGSKSLPITIRDAQNRAGSSNIALNVATPFVAPNVKISQVYGGGGNSGATYRNDFVELYNAGASGVDLANYSVQVASAGATASWSVTSLCTAGPCVLQPGHYYLVQEALGQTPTGVQVPLPQADAIGLIAMSASSAKVALVASTTALTGACPTGGFIVDMVGYGSASCSETHAAAGLGNTTADARKDNGCTDTDDNSADFVEIIAIPRNVGSPAHACRDDARTSAVGSADPSGPERNRFALLTVHVTPPTGAPLPGSAVVADLSSIGGSASQPLFDDGTTGGDGIAGDGTFSYLIAISTTAAYGMHNILATVTDSFGQTLVESIPLTVSLPSCGTERWLVKVGDDHDASQVNLSNATETTIQALRAFSAPTFDQSQPNDSRIGVAELTAWVLNATMTLFKKEADVDYHIVLSDTSGTLISEIPEPECASDPSPFKAGIAAARATFDEHLTATSSFQSVTLPVRVTGVGFFDFIHGQTGVAPNGIELHPVLDIMFQSETTTTVASSANPSKYLDGVDFTATVSSTVATPTGMVTFLDGGSVLGTAALDAEKHATFHVSLLSVGPHPITARYLGDTTSTRSHSTVLTQTVNKADQTITFAPLPGKTFGDPDFTIGATSDSGLGVTLAIASGPATLAANEVHITGAGKVVVRATQTGDEHYEAATPVDQSFEVAKAGQTITFTGPVPTPLYGAQPFEVTATGGASGNPVTFTGQRACTVQGQNGIATVTIVSGGECDVVASQTGNDNYSAALDATEVITIGRATADVKVKPVTFVYDGQSHGLTGKAIGVSGEDLGSLLDLGSKFTNVPGGTADWSFAGNQNYVPVNGQEDVTITQATPVFSGLSSPTVEAGTSTTLRGVVSLGTLVPTGAVVITLNHVSQTAPVGPDGHFETTFAGGLPLSSTPYPVDYRYNGDGNFNPVSGVGSVTIVDTTPPSIGSVSASPSVLAPPNHKMIDVTLAYQASDVTGAPACSVSVASNEPINGNGDGNTSADWQVLDAHHVQLRSERAGGGSGRVYTITIRCTDSSGLTGLAATTVSVPK